MGNAYSTDKIAFHSDRLDDMRKGRQAVPVNIQLVPSDWCNADCSYCAYRASNGLSVQQFGGLDKKGNQTHNPLRMIPEAKLREIVDDAAELGVKSITWTGGGEPTAHPDHMEMFERALDRGLECSLNTNGMVLRDGWKDILPRFTYVRFSFDGATKEEYAAIRRTRPEVFDKVLGNIRSVVDEVKRQASPCVVGGGYVVTPQFHASTARAVEILRSTGVSYVRLASMQSTEDSAVYGDDLEAARASVRQAKTLRTPSFEVFDQFDAALGKRMSDSFCGFQQIVIYIGGNQKVYRCCYVAYSDVGEIGDLRETSLKDWFRSAGKEKAITDFDARTCRSCPLVKKNEAIAALLTQPVHVNFL
jgi:MoaA/NifB/PqqE/SkfB family radical SAM enzyme